MDLTFARQASRRVGVAVRLNLHAGRRRNYGHNRRLSRAQVNQARAWAIGEGWGLSRRDQARVLAPVLGVSLPTIKDVLDNQSWFDPAYHPDVPNPNVWANLPLSAVLLRLLARKVA